jgi:hypothetical protein
MSEKKPVQLQIKVDEPVAQGEYANFLSILHNPTEFVLDFGRLVPGSPEVRVKSRILTTPFHARRFLETLKQNVDMYEKSFGPIRTDFGPDPHTSGPEGMPS